MTIADKLTTIAENVQKVYEAGQAAGGGVDAGIDLFWETFQQGGARTSYNENFGGGKWTDETFKPKYTIWLTGARSSTFENSTITNYDALKMVDFSKVDTWHYMFKFSKASHWGVIDTRGHKYGPLTELFYGSVVETIDKLIFKDDGSQTFELTFVASKLANITVEGTIGYNPVFSPCPNLTHDSLMSIIEHLKDFSGTTTTKTLTLHATAKARLTEEDIAIATQKGWTVA